MIILMLMLMLLWLLLFYDDGRPRDLTTAVGIWVHSSNAHIIYLFLIIWGHLLHLRLATETWDWRKRWANVIRLVVPHIIGWIKIWSAGHCRNIGMPIVGFNQQIIFRLTEWRRSLDDRIVIWLFGIDIISVVKLSLSIACVSLHWFLAWHHANLLEGLGLFYLC